MSYLNRFCLVPALFLALTVMAVADSATLWPIPQPPPGTPIDAFPLPRLEWLYQFQEHLQQSRSKPVDLIFDGDSVTEFWQRDGKAIWQERYGPLNPFNMAMTWERVQHLLWRLDHHQVTGLHPKLVVLLIGTHNVGRSTPEEIAAGIKTAVDDYRKDCPEAHVLLLGIFPRGEKPDDSARPQITQINQLLAKLDDGKNVTFLDIGAKFLQPDGTISKDVMNDFVHPTEKGYRIWADAIQPIVDQYCPKASATVAGAPTTPPAVNPGTPLTYPWFPPRIGTPATTFPVPNLDWFERFEGNLRKQEYGPYDLVFDGDSITDNWQGPGREVMAQRYGGIKLLDVAIGGDQTQHVLWRVQHGDLESQNPKLIVLMIGTNNGGRNPADVCAGIKLILHEYETRCPNAHILLLGVFPRGAEAKSGSRDWIKNINQILATYNDGKKVTFMDIGSKFLQPDGTLTAEIMPDFLHPSAKGYVIWADAIQPVIDHYFPKPETK